MLTRELFLQWILKKSIHTHVKIVGFCNVNESCQTFFHLEGDTTTNKIQVKNQWKCFLGGGAKKKTYNTWVAQVCTAFHNGI